MPGIDLPLLALGGGARGLSSLMILQQLMAAVDPDAPPKPCDYFDVKSRFRKTASNHMTCRVVVTSSDNNTGCWRDVRYNISLRIHGP